VPVPASAVGTSAPAITVTVDRSRLALFAKATGQTDPMYTDVATAHAHGHPDLPVPPTFLFGLELEQPDPFAWITALGVDMNTVLHGTQGFDYYEMAYAGQALTARSTITDVYSKRAGALEFIDRRTDVTRDGESVALLTQTIVIRNGQAL
jgi:acyl dehydratase